MLSSVALPMVPGMTVMERSIKETELLSLSSLSASDFHRADQLQVLEKILQSCTPAPPNFTGTIQKATGEESSVLKRRYFRNISAFTFSQILSSDVMREPEVIKKYYPMTDELLLALYWPAPHRKMARESWKPQISSETIDSLKALYGGSEPPPPVPITPPVLTRVKGSTSSAKNSQKNVILPIPIVVEVEEPATSLIQHNLTITPAGNAIMMVKQTTLTGAAWLSIYTDGNILGLRYGSLIIPAVHKKSLVPVPIVPVVEKEKEAAAKPEPAAAKGKKGAKPEKKGKAAKDEKPAKVEIVEEIKEEIPLKVENTEMSIAEEKNKSNNNLNKSEGQILDLKDAYFFCHTEDEVRIVSFMGPKSALNKKPDKHGTVCVLCMYTSGLQVLLCSNGLVKCHTPLQISATTDTVLRCTDPTVSVPECARYISAGATVVRHFSYGPYLREVLSPNGTRTLIKRQVVLDVTTVGAIEVVVEDGFHSYLLSNGPTDWKYVRLYNDGSVRFYSCEPGTVPESRGVSLTRSSDQNIVTDTNIDTNSSSVITDTGIDAANCSSVIGDTLHSSGSVGGGGEIMKIMTVRLDAETLAEVCSFEDGRLIVIHKDGLREVYYLDGTKMVTHPEGSIVYVTKDGLPSLEVDTVLDRISSDHSKGIKVPLAKGGDKVRLRAVLPDGSAAMIKYDTRITSKVNGSLKIVRRDRTVIIVKDDGVVTYSPRTAWDDEAASLLLSDSRDTPVGVPGGGGGGGGGGVTGGVPSSPRKNMLAGTSVTFAAENSMGDGHFRPLSPSQSPPRLNATDHAIRGIDFMSPRDRKSVV